MTARSPTSRARPSSRLGGRHRLRRSQRQALARLRRHERPPEPVDERVAIQVCSTCGQLQWPRADHPLDPMRGAPLSSLTRRPLCGHCGDRSWLDLRRDETALMLSDEDVRRGDVGRWSGRSPAIVGALLVFVMQFVLYAFLGGSMFHPLPVAIGCLPGLLWLYWARQRASRGPVLGARPVRWSMMPLPGGETIDEVIGPAKPTEELLVAPLSGRRCIAYEVGVRPDTRASAPDHTWWLLEQRVAPMQVAECTLPVDGAHLELPRERWSGTTQGSLSAAAQEFLRQRGLTVGSADFEVFESILEPDAAVCVSRAEHGAIVRPA